MSMDRWNTFGSTPDVGCDAIIDEEEPKKAALRPAATHHTAGMDVDDTYNNFGDVRKSGEGLRNHAILNPIQT